MRELLILIVVITAVVFLAPMILSFVIFLLFAAAIVILLFKLGLLPGFRYVRYGGDPRRSKSSRQRKWDYRERGDGDPYNGGTDRSDPSRSKTNSDNSGGWYQTSQDGEEVTLPETALRKEVDETNNGGRRQ